MVALASTTRRNQPPQGILWTTSLFPSPFMLALITLLYLPSLVLGSYSEKTAKACGVEAKCLEHVEDFAYYLLLDGTGSHGIPKNYLDYLFCLGGENVAREVMCCLGPPLCDAVDRCLGGLDVSVDLGVGG